MYILGLESSCDETSAAIVRMDTDADGTCHREICANMIASQIETHRLYGGVVPEIAGRAHIEAVSRITYEALDTAGLTMRDIGAIAVTTHPGLIGALLVGEVEKDIFSVAHIGRLLSEGWKRGVGRIPPLISCIKDSKNLI